MMGVAKNKKQNKQYVDKHEKWQQYENSTY